MPGSNFFKLNNLKIDLKKTTRLDPPSTLGNAPATSRVMIALAFFNVFNYFPLGSTNEICVIASGFNF